MTPSTKMVLLLAEDQEDDVLLFKRALLKAGVSVALHHVNDGEEAIDYLKGGKDYDREAFPFPDLLIVDLKMPKRTGFDVIDWVRKKSDSKRLRIVVLSSSREKNDINRAYESGANAYMSKPNNFDQLISMIKHLHMYWAELSECPDCSGKAKSKM